MPTDINSVFMEAGSGIIVRDVVGGALVLALCSGLISVPDAGFVVGARMLHCRGQDFNVCLLFIALCQRGGRFNERLLQNRKRGLP